MLNKLRKKASKLAVNDSKYEKIAILLDLGYDSHEAMKLYIELTSRK